MPASHEINAVHEKELPEMLESLGLLVPIKNGSINCSFCSKVITLDNFNCIYPKKGEIKVCCDDIRCYQKALVDSKEKGEKC